MNTAGDAATAAELNRLLRATDDAAPPADDPSSQRDLAEPSAVRRNTQYLLEHWTLGDAATVADWPRVGPWLARVPVLGGLLAFARESYGALWQLAHRRAPVGQQVAFNRAVALSLQEVAWHLDELDQIMSLLDHELQACRKDAALLADEALRLQQETTDESGSAQVGELTEGAASLTQAVDGLQAQLKPSAHGVRADSDG